METGSTARDTLLTEEGGAAHATAFQGVHVLTIAGAHFVHDTYSAFLAPLLPLVQERLGTSYAGTGSLAIFAQLPSLLNPFLGYIADRVSLRYFVILAPGITATLFGSLGLAPNYLTLALLLFAAGVSIAAFHAPAPAMVARFAGQRVGKGMSIFMAGGELGRTLGPVMAVTAVGWFALEGIWRVAVVGWAVSILLFFRLRTAPVASPAIKPAAIIELWSQIRNVFAVLTWLVAARIFLLVALTTYLPLYASDARSLSLWLSAASLTILEGAGVAGALFSGTVSDRLGRRRMLLILLTISPILHLLFVLAPTWASVPLLIALGLTALGPQPVILALVQDSFPHHRALGNGIYLAINFLVRAIGIWLVGLMADQLGLQSAFVISGVLAFLSIPAVFFLPDGGSGE